MSTAVLERPIAVDEPEVEVEKPCTLRWVATGFECQLPAAWAFTFKCCGYVKVLCDSHFNELLEFVQHIRCRGCGHEYAWNAVGDVVARAWRI